MSELEALIKSLQADVAYLKEQVINLHARLNPRNATDPNDNELVVAMKKHLVL